MQRTEHSADSTESGFLDISANALAVIILATMIVLFLSAVPEHRGEVEDSTPKVIAYPPPIDAALTPLARYFIVTTEGVTALDLDALTLGLDADNSSASSEQGDLSFRVNRVYRDVNEYSALLTLDEEALKQTALPVDQPDMRAELIAELAEGYESRNISPVFLVRPDAVDVFAKIYWELRQTEAVLRWSTLRTNEIRLFRNAQSFNTILRTWK